MDRCLEIATIALFVAMLVAPTLLQTRADETSTLYDLTGTWTLHYTYPQDDLLTTENQTMAINYFNSDTGYFSGFGFNNNNPAYNWTLYGFEEFPSESDNNVEFTITYDQNSPIPDYYIIATGSISNSTYMSGTATLPTLPESEEIASVSNEASWEAVKTSPDPNIVLSFPPGINVQFVNVTEYNSSTSPYPPLPHAIGPIYNITVVIGTLATNLATNLASCGLRNHFTVGIHYDPSLVSNPSRLIVAQFDFPVGDVNHDGTVDLLDLLTILKALGSTPTSPNWNPNCDLNGDGKVDLTDLCLAMQNLGRTGTWVNLPTTVDTINNFVYGTTDHFSGFGIHL